MELIYTFTAEEARALAIRKQRWLEAMALIAEIHGIAGEFTLSPDETGFVRPPRAMPAMGGE